MAFKATGSGIEILFRQQGSSQNLLSRFPPAQDSSRKMVIEQQGTSQNLLSPSEMVREQQGTSQHLLSPSASAHDSSRKMVIGQQSTSQNLLSPSPPAPDSESPAPAGKETAVASNRLGPSRTLQSSPLSHESKATGCQYDRLASTTTLTRRMDSSQRESGFEVVSHPPAPIHPQGLSSEAPPYFSSYPHPQGSYFALPPHPPSPPHDSSSTVLPHPPASPNPQGSYFTLPPHTSTSPHPQGCSSKAPYLQDCAESSEGSYHHDCHPTPHSNPHLHSDHSPSHDYHRQYGYTSLNGIVGYRPTAAVVTKRFLSFVKTFLRDARAYMSKKSSNRRVLSDSTSVSLTAPILGNDVLGRDQSCEENDLSAMCLREDENSDSAFPNGDGANDSLLNQDNEISGRSDEDHKTINNVKENSLSVDSDATEKLLLTNNDVNGNVIKHGHYGEKLFRKFVEVNTLKQAASKRCAGFRRYCASRMTSITPVSVLWSLLSVLVASACGVSFFNPHWIVHPDHLHSFGLFTQCVRDPDSPAPRALCKGYGPGKGQWGGVELSSIPAGAWQASTLLYGSGVALECVGALMTLVLLMIPSRPYSGRKLSLLNGYLQTVAVLIMLAGLLMFPLGFSTPFFQYYCESTRAFCVGHCRMGWSYVLAITATALAIFCPVLSNYTDMTFEKDGDEEAQDSRTVVASV